MGKGQIAGILQGLRRLLRPVSGSAPAVEQLSPALDPLCPAAIEMGIQINGTAVQGRRHSQDLEGGSRLVAIGNHPVAPLLQSGLGQQIRVGLPAPDIFLGIFREGSVFRLQRFQLPGSLLVSHPLVVVGVVAAQGGHGQNFSCLAVHHQTKGTVLHIIFGDGLPEPVFQAALDRGVQGKYQVAAFSGYHQILIRKGHIHFVAALGGEYSGHWAGEECIVCRLDSFAALAGQVGKADDLAGQVSKRVAPADRGLQMDTGNVLLQNIAPDLIRRLRRNAAGHLLIAAAGILRLLQNPLGLFSQPFPQKEGELFQIYPGLLQLLGVQVDVLHRAAYRQHIHVPVV